MSQALTVAEKILFHLFQYIKSEEKYEVPFDVTQDGIAQSCGISRAHAAIELKKLRESQQIIEKLSHVRKAKSRRKVYFLTQVGKERAGKIVDHVHVENVPTGVDPTRISQDSGPAKRLRKHSSAIPNPKAFFGRKNELQILGSMSVDDGTDIVGIIGLGGIGKTTLLAKFAKDAKSSIFWYSLNDWETDVSLFRALAVYLEDCGDKRLSNYMHSDAFDLGEIGYILADSFIENGRMLMFDDVDKSPRLHNALKMIIQNCGPNKVFLTMEAVPAFLGELRSAGESLKEMLLEGLDIEASRELLASRGIQDEKADQLHTLSGGHPMLLGLMTPGDESAAKVEMSKFVKSTLLRELPPKDMSVVEKCSILRKPFSVNYLARDERYILTSPIFFQMSENFCMHEIVRRIVADQIPANEAAAFHSIAADHYLAEPNAPERLFHLISAGRYPEAERLVHTHSDELLAEELPQNLLKELSSIPPSLSKYAPSVKILMARASSKTGDEPGAIDSLRRMASELNGDGRANVLIELSGRQMDASKRKKVLKDLEKTLSEKGISQEVHSRIALSVANMRYYSGELDRCEKMLERGLSSAANAFSLNTICSLNRLMGQILVSREEYPRAIAFLSQTAPSFAGEHRPLFHRLMAKSLASSNDFEGARLNLEQSASIAESNGMFKELSESLMEMSTLRLRLEDLDGAAESCFRCIEVSSSIGEKLILAKAYKQLSSIERKRGNSKEAEESKTLAEKILKETSAPAGPSKA